MVRANFKVEFAGVSWKKERVIRSAPAMIISINVRPTELKLPSRGKI